MKNFLAALDTESLALAASVARLLFVQFLALFAWQSDLLTREAAVVHWLVVGVMPPALALWSMPDPDATRR